MSNESRILNKRRSLARKRKMLLFICTGDTCRSPMVAGYLKYLMEIHEIRDLEVRTCGVMTVNGLLPSDESMEMLGEKDIDNSGHRSRPLTPELIKRANLILGMTPIHVQTAQRIDETAKGKTFLLREYAGTVEGKNSQINDPMGCTLEVYKNCFKLITKACDNLLKKEFFDDLKPKTSQIDEKIRNAAEAQKEQESKKIAKPAAKKAGKSTNKKAVKKAVKKTAKKAAKKTTKKSAKATTKKAVKKTTKKAVKKTAKKAGKKVAKKTAKKTVRKARK